MIVVGVTQQSSVPAQPGRQESAGGGGNPLPAPAAESNTGAAAAAAAAASSSRNDGTAALTAAQRRVQQHVQTFIAEHDQEAHFSVDQSTGMTIVQIVNRASGELVRQIPTEEVVRIAQFLNAQTAFVNVKA
jgi:flagellar protein FlaG